MAMKIQVAVSWVVTLRGDLHPEEGGSTILRNFGILQYNYTAPQPRRLRLELIARINFSRSISQSVC
jgi:hypothetical protein